MKPIEIESKWLPGGIGAITLWPFVIFRKGNKTKCVQMHEMYHWKQALRWGVIPWYCLYLILQLFYFRKPANEHPMEKEAYKIQWACERNR